MVFSTDTVMTGAMMLTLRSLFASMPTKNQIAPKKTKPYSDRDGGENYTRSRLQEITIALERYILFIL